MKRPILLLALLFLAAGLVPASSQVSLQPPHLAVERGEELSRLYLEVVTPGGESVRRLLRETPAVPVPGLAGWGPAAPQ